MLNTGGPVKTFVAGISFTSTNSSGGDEQEVSDMSLEMFNDRYGHIDDVSLLARAIGVASSKCADLVAYGIPTFFCTEDIIKIGSLWRVDWEQVARKLIEEMRPDGW